MWAVMIDAPAVLLAGAQLIAPCAPLRGAEAPQAIRALTPVTADEAKPFLGAWTSTMDGPAGPINLRIALDVDDGKVIARVSSDLMSEGMVADIIRTETEIALHYTANLWGYSVPMVLNLAAQGDTLQANVLLMQGQFVLSGVATRQLPC